MSDAGPMRHTSDLADMVELLLDKGVVVNADIAVTIGETELLSVKIRAAIASFETAAQYGLEFPDGTDPERIQAAASPSRGVPSESDPDADAETGGGVNADGTVESDTEREATGASTDQMGTRPSAAVTPAIRRHHGEDSEDDED
jgi:hypothetical protein